MGEQSSRILLIENCQRGMSPTMAQLARDAASLLRLNLCSSLSEATHRLESGSYDLVLSGLDVADSTGVTTVKNIKALSGQTPVAVLFNDDQWHMEGELRQLGVSTFYKTGDVDVSSLYTLTAAVDNPQKTVSSAENQAEEAVEEDTITNADVSISPSDAETVMAADDSQETVAEPVDLTETDETVSQEESVLQNFAAEESQLQSDDAIVLDESAAMISSEQESESEPEVFSAETEEIAERSDDFPEEPAGESVIDCDHDKHDDQSEQMVNAEEIEKTVDLVRHEYEDKLSALNGQLEEEKAQRLTLSSTLEEVRERCAELEAGQTALIEAEHVAIEREKAAREIAEKRVWDLEERLKGMEAPRELEEQIERLSNELEQAQKRAREAELAPAAQLEVLKNQLKNERTEHTKMLDDSTTKAEEIQQRLRKTSQELQDCQYKLYESETACKKAEERATELEDISSRFNEQLHSAEDLQKQLDNAVARQIKAETSLQEKERRCVELAGKIERLEALVNQLHTLVDRVSEADQVASDLEHMKMMLITEKSARRRLNAQLRKMQSLEDKYEKQRESVRELQWLLQEKEQAAADALALVDDLKQGGAGADNEHQTTELVNQVKSLQKRLAEVEKEKQEITGRQMEKLEELKALYEKSQAQRLELTAKLSGKKPRKKK